MLKIDLEIVDSSSSSGESEEEDISDSSEESSAAYEETDNAENTRGNINSFDADINPVLLKTSMESISNASPFKESKTDGAHKAGEFEEMIDKLDRMMLVVFEYLAEKLKIIDKESSEEQEQALQLFTHLLTIFEKVILTTHKSRFVQFIIFHACSLNHSLVPIFVDFLMTRLFQPRLPAVTRQSLAMYTSSFIARHDQVSSELIMFILKRLSFLCEMSGAFLRIYFCSQQTF
ncbi:RNA polymerase I-specific transcription initiation factor RRN3-like [Zophobas morio]|uniref:RNA polymerase I-specific transcription initiation factor RRN3-like n=1 Tax=Zophobas morio TaxID=2755281 RepID=UPI003082DE4A